MLGCDRSQGHFDTTSAHDLWRAADSISPEFLCSGSLLVGAEDDAQAVFDHLRPRCEIGSKELEWERLEHGQEDSGKFAVCLAKLRQVRVCQRVGERSRRARGNFHGNSHIAVEAGGRKGTKRESSQPETRISRS